MLNQKFGSAILSHIYSNIDIKKLLSNESSCIIKLQNLIYFLFKKSSTNSGAITDSTNI